MGKCHDIDFTCGEQHVHWQWWKQNPKPQPWICGNPSSFTRNVTAAKFHSGFFTQVFWPLYTISLYIPFFFFFFLMQQELFPRIPLSNTNIFVANTVTSCQGNKGQLYTFELKSPTVDIEKAKRHEKNNLKFKTTICENWLTACVCI